MDFNYTQLHLIVLCLFRFRTHKLIVVFILVIRGLLGEAVIAVLVAQGSSSADASEQALWAIRNLASDAGLNAKLGIGGACNGSLTHLD